MSEDPSGETTESAEFHRVVPRYSSLFTRQAAFVTVMILLTGCGLTIAGYGFARLILTDQIHERLNLVAAERKNSLLAYLSHQRERTQILNNHTELLHLLDAFAEDLLPENTFQQQAGEILLDIRRSFEPTGIGQDGGRFLAITLLDADGNPILSSGSPLHEGPFGDMQEYIDGRDHFVLGRISSSGEHKRVLVAAPLDTEANRLFVAIVELDANPLMNLLTPPPSGEGQTGGIVVGREVNGQLYLMNPLQDKQLLARDPAQLPYLQPALQGKIGYGPSIDWDGRPVIAASLPLNFDGWALAVKVGEAEAYEPLGRLQIMLFGLAGGTLLAGILLSYVFTFRITRPLRQLVRFSSSVAHGKFEERCPIDGDDEIGTLAKSLNYMAQQLQQSYSTLEQRVERRAAQLIDANEQLTQEVSARAATERALEQEQFLLHTLLETLPDNIYFKDRESRFIRIGRVMAQRFGLTDAAEAIGKTDHDFFTEPHANQARRDEEDLMRSGEPIIELEEPETWPDGRLTWVASTKMLLRNDAGELVGTFGISRDITQRRQAEIALREAKEAADAANRAKSEFVANMSHEIRTPLNGIIGMTDLALDTPLNSQQRDYLETVAQSAETLLLIVNDILDFSKIEAGKLDLESTEFQLHDTLDNTLHTLALRAHKKGLELAYYVAPEVPNHLIGDPVRFRQIITNLVGNAIKFTQQGEVVIRIVAEHSTEDQVKLQVQVSDTGIGIPPEKQRAVFEAFTQADASTTRKFGGTGLGLTISAFLVKRMQGEIWLESEESTGTTFFFTAVFDWHAEPTPEPTAARKERLRNARILIVDDNQTNLRIMHEMLAAWGTLPTSVTNAVEALEVMQNAVRNGSPFAVCVTDCHMPEMDGFSLIENIRADAELKDTVVLMLSSGMMPGDTERARSLEIAAHLLKPVRQTRLLKILDAAMLGEDLDKSEVGLATVGAVRQLPPLHVLVAEDGLVNQKLVRELLHKQGHRVTVANNGREAVDTCLAESPDIVLMDVQMPVLDGLEATEQIRLIEKSSGRRVPIVAMTAHAMKGDRERCLQAGMDQYVSKPLRAQELFEAMAASLGQAAAGVRQQPVDAPAEDTDDRINWPKVLDAVNGDREILQSVIEAHLDESPKLLGQIRSAIADGDASRLQRASHTLKGSLRFFGAHAAGELAWQLETAGKNADLAAAPNLLEELESLVQSTDRAIAEGPND